MAHLQNTIARAVAAATGNGTITGGRVTDTITGGMITGQNRRERPERRRGDSGTEARQIQADASKTNSKKDGKRKRKQRRQATDKYATDRSIKIYHKEEKNGDRHVTIAYRISPERSLLNVEFAACIFNKDNKDDVFIGRHHNQTARGRLVVRPLFATFVFSDELKENLLKKDIPIDKTERRRWLQTEEGMRWSEIRREFYDRMGKFLRKQIGLCGMVKAEKRMKRSEIERARTTGIVALHDYNKGKRIVEKTMMSSAAAELRKRHANLERRILGTFRNEEEDLLRAIQVDV